MKMPSNTHCTFSDWGSSEHLRSVLWLTYPQALNEHCMTMVTSKHYWALGDSCDTTPLTEYCVTYVLATIHGEWYRWSSHRPLRYRWSSHRPLTENGLAELWLSTFRLWCEWGHHKTMIITECLRYHWPGTEHNTSDGARLQCNWQYDFCQFQSEHVVVWNCSKRCLNYWGLEWGEG